MSKPSPSLLVVTAPPRQESGDQRQVRIELLKQAQSHGWGVMPLVRTVTIGHYVGVTTGRRVQVLTPQDARDAYKAAHKGPLAVLATTSFQVRPDPSADPAPDRALWSAEDFLRHKAHFAQVRAVRHVGEALRMAEESLKALCCDGTSDPRVLPMHAFSPEGHVHDLRSDEGRKAFKVAYGAPSSRRDPNGRVWKTGPFHGRDVAHVAGVALPVGFHWDVSNGRSSGRCRIVNGWQVWELTGRRGYANIGPNAFIRRGNNECVLRWPKA